MDLLLAFMVVTVCGTCQSYCVGRVRTVVPVPSARCNPAISTVDDINALVYLMNSPIGAGCSSCGYLDGNCLCNNDYSYLQNTPRSTTVCRPGCSCYDCTAIVNILVDALVKTVVNSHGGSGGTGNPHPHPYPSRPSPFPPHNGGTSGNGGNSGSGGNNLIDLGLLQPGRNGGVDIANLGLGNQGVLGVNLGGNSRGNGGGGPQSPGSSGPGSSPGGLTRPSGPTDQPNNVIQLDLLEQNKKGGVTVADLALGGKGVLGIDLGGIAV